ncbi:MAG: hypothetical protein ACO29O_06385 [Chitinophagaceae bacterium]
MRYILAIVFVSLLTISAMAQKADTILKSDSTLKSKKTDWRNVDLSKRAADHFLFQFGMAGWASKPDSIKPVGFSRSFNMYVMLDFPFKSNPQISVAIGPGIGMDNIFLKQTKLDVRAGSSSKLLFVRDTLDQIKKYKLTSVYAELPVELRFAQYPDKMNKGIKGALGLKIGTLVDIHTKSKVTKDTQGTGGYVSKVKDTYFFNRSRLVATARIGYGNISFFGTYTLTEFIKDGFGPVIKPFSAGITISGL